MATYVNDLRLKEIATGDESGTWGTSTNTNLELIAEAFSFGTEAITTNADTHTTTIADGSTDPGRSIFLKYTGTLDSACTITIGPNTVSKLWLIENATSGSQSIIIKQGSVAGITILNGQTKAIYSDGAGSGAAMVDAFQDLSIPDLFIDDDLTFTSDSAVITFGADGDTTLTHTDGSGLTLNSTNKIMFNDASQFIQGSSATVLALGATDEIDLTATALDFNGNADVSGTLAVGGVVTANAGVVVDNITIDGTEIDLSSGDLTIDVAGDIKLDAGGNDWIFLNGGTAIGRIINSSSDFVIQSDVADKDIIFKGDDGGSGITALTLDMSAAGAATFNSTIASSVITAKSSGNTDSALIVQQTGSTDGWGLTPDNTNGNLDFVRIGGGAGTYFRLSNDGSVSTPTAGTSNTRIGVNAGNSIASGGNYNVVVGDEAGTALTTGDGNVAVGFEALKTEDAHGANTAVGFQALKTLNAGATGYNTAVGYEAGELITTGIQNTLIGSLAADAMTVGQNNVAIGVAALSSDVGGSRTVAIGRGALETQNMGSSDTNSHNVAVGYGAGAGVTTGDRNTLIGALAGDALNTGAANVAVGYLALSADTKGSSNVAVGRSALTAQNFTTGTDSFNTAVGDRAGTAVTTGTNNTLIGGLAGDALTTGDQNVAVGTGALSTDDVGKFSTAIGYAALNAQNFATATNAYNVAVGHSAGLSVTTGVQNTLIGGLAGDAITDADFNVALGYLALTTNQLGSSSVAIGTSALQNQNPATAASMLNVAVGHDAGAAVTTAVFNTLVGGLAGDALTTGQENAAFGYLALSGDTLGSHSVAVGSYALQAQNFTTATDSFNTAVGYAAGTAVTTGIQNTIIGALAGDAVTTGQENVYIGYGAATADDQSDANVIIGSLAGSEMNHGDATGFTTIVGYQAGFYNVTGTSNTYIGYRAGHGSANQSNATNTAVGREAMLQVTTGGTNSFLGSAAGLGVTSGSNNFGIGADSGRSGSPGGGIATSSNIGVLGDENISSLNCQVALTVASDERDKTDFVDLDLGLDFVKALEPVTYYWDKRSKYGDKYSDDYDLNAQTPDGTHKEDWMDVGFKAQSVKTLEEAAGYTLADKKNLTVSLSTDEKQYGLRYEKFIPILVKAIQDQDAIIQSLTARIAALES